MDTTASSANHSAPLPRLINWELAATTAARLTPAGPKLSGTQIRSAVENLRGLADVSVDHVHRITGLDAARDLRDSQVLVVDRAAWSKANARSFELMLQPALKALAEKRPDQLKSAATALGSAVTGTQMGAILSFLSSKVLGQYDPFSALLPGGPAGGRLLLVAPNIIALEQELNVEPADFRLWVCLHEQTHRVQFAAAPWLRAHMLEQISELSSSIAAKADSLGDRLQQALKVLASSAKAAASGQEPAAGEGAAGSLLELFRGPEEKAVFSHLTAVMSLLEGHANVVMDAVDASVVPTVKTIRQRFNARSKNRSALENWVRRLMGLDAKARQYTDGAKFVRAVVDRVGMEGFNRVWERAENLPTEQEIHQPELWISRMDYSRA
ncbi:zinc-dependent metalloprotease [Arthrobacter mobilis]|uniref:Zinc-dependent metalloprotease n=1 Tax=Arthrobacter mobilis TaxID=2724944 RepID=A0A7X6HDN9_9MICC|nr:zinc-dependent metalloprotease [Arthrobacter mobilis]NKX55096.1 zinc-dependent metalloprotease [Arthrobacter mobilis]